MLQRLTHLRRGRTARDGLIAAFVIAAQLIIRLPSVSAQDATTDYTPIYAIQGPGNASPLAGSRVHTMGVVTGLTGDGFYIQDPAGDGDPLTSDGVYVYTYSPPLHTFPVLAVGRCVSVHDSLVQEYYGKTELSRVGDVASSSACAARYVSAVGLPLLHLGADPQQLLERFEGMLVAVQELDGFVHGPTKRYVSGETEIALLPAALHSVVETGRILRTSEDTENLDEASAVPWAGDSLSFLSSLIGDELPTAHWGDRIRHVGDSPLLAVLDYNFGKYQLLLLPEQKLRVEAGTYARETGLKDEPDTFAVCTYNVHGLGRGDAQHTDHRAYERALGRTADVIAGPLAGCSVLALQETGTPEDASALASRLSEAHQLPYLAVAVEGPMSSDAEFPLTNSFLVRSDRVRIVNWYSVQACSNRDYGVQTMPDESCPLGQYPLFNRPPLVMDVTVAGDWGEPFALRLINNHWKSKAGDETVNAKRRLSQAEAVEEILQESHESGVENVMVLGDLNDFSDSAPLHQLTGTTSGTSSALVNSWDLLTESDRYSFIFNGASQVLDHILIDPSMVQFVAGVDALHINADFAMCATDAELGPCQFSDHDPLAVLVRPGGAATLGGDLGYAGIDVRMVDQDGGKTVMTRTGSDGEYRLWDVQLGEATLTYEAPEWLLLGDSDRVVTEAITVTIGFEMINGPTVRLRPAMHVADETSRLVDETVADP